MVRMLRTWIIPLATGAAVTIALRAFVFADMTAEAANRTGYLIAAGSVVFILALGTFAFLSSQK